MTLLLDAGAALLFLLVAPLTVWAERRAKAWVQLRRGPSPLQPYRDLRRLWHKHPLAPDTAGPLYFAAPGLALAIVAAALLTLPLAESGSGLGGGAALLALGLLLALHRAILAAQAYDTGTPFGGLGSSRELFLGGLGEPVLLLVAATVFLQTGSAAVPAAPLPLAAPSLWLIASALVLLWIAESARIPFDNPATHLELTMVHEAMILESSGWMLALHEIAAMVKQTTLAALVLLLVVPLPAAGPSRLAILAVSVVALSGGLAVVESGVAKLRLFRASHLLIMAALLAFLGGSIALLEGGRV